MDDPTKLKLLRTTFVASLAEHIETQDFVITSIVQPDDAGLPAPEERSGFRADIEARDKTGRKLFGIVVLDEDFTPGGGGGTPPVQAADAGDANTLPAKLKYFSTLYMRDTKLPAILYVGYPHWTDVPAKLKKLYGEIGVDWKMKHILFVRIDD